VKVTAIVGANWGDEGKGKITDYLAAESSYVVRFQGGKNAGHTIINEHGKFALHLLPSGVFYPGVTNVLGPGVALDVEAFVRERAELLGRGIAEPRLKVSDRAQVVMPYHVLFDKYEEERLADRKFGSTRSGIAPFYADKYLKIGVQTADLFDEPRLRRRLEAALAVKNSLLEHLYHEPLVDLEGLLAQMGEWGRSLEPFLCDTTELLHGALARGEHILLEGQLGALRDPDHGIYPYPTSSSTLAGFGSVGAGVPPHAIDRVIAVTKSYSTCVGEGPFTTEIFGELAAELRNRGGDAGEYGATTGRPRRMGWFDAVATRYGCRVQGATEVALTMLDVLGYMDSVPICTAYRIDGGRTESFPVPAQLDRAEPVLETLKGWRTDIRDVRRYEDLPAGARDYVATLEQLIETPIRWISVGPKREAIIRK
jgi:adenylosuccinate synthase